ncbi:MAG: transcriptional repressor [Proteobacteria bacterium]|nr:transcriptional repressor [Pseudomonadota bacterium]
MGVSIERICVAYGMKMTEQRRLVLKVIEESNDHPDVEELYKRAYKLDEKISLATVYRTIASLLEYGLLSKLELEDGRARYELVQNDGDHHHHLIDLESGKIIEFYNEELERIKEEIAQRLGYKLIRHRLELYGVPLEGK